MGTMVYELAHTIQKDVPQIWEGIEALNSFLFLAKVRQKRHRIGECLADGIRIAELEDAPKLALFFSKQPEESFKWFRPHAFDEKTLRKLLKRDSYVMYVMEEDGEMIGYAFLRCFFNGKCFLGKIVDVGHRGKGVCTKLCAAGMEMASMMGLRMFESINKENIGSMKASEKACDVIVVEELEGGDVLIEDRKKGSLRL